MRSRARLNSRPGSGNRCSTGPPISAANVRRARPDDEAFVVALGSRFAETRPAWRTDDEITLGTANQLRRAFDAPETGAAIFIAEDGHGERTGFAYVVFHIDFFTGERHGHISEVAAVRDGTGAGRLLMQAAERYFRDLGVRFVTLNVHVDNERAARFYETLGFAAQVRQFVKVLA